MNKVLIKIAGTADEVAISKEIRRKVFQQEQGIDEKLDFDGYDDASEHVLLQIDHNAAATARIRYPDEKTAKVERVAVLPEFRGKNIGRSIMNFIEEHVKEKGSDTVIMNVQENAIGFYEKLGYTPIGEKFMAVGITHVTMKKELN